MALFSRKAPQDLLWCRQGRQTTATLFGTSADFPTKNARKKIFKSQKCEPKVGRVKSLEEFFGSQNFDIFSKTFHHFIRFNLHPKLLWYRRPWAYNAACTAPGDTSPGRTASMKASQPSHCWWKKSFKPVEVGSLSHCLQGFLFLMWLLGISSINNIRQNVHEWIFSVRWVVCLSKGFSLIIREISPVKTLFLAAFLR